MSYDTIAEFCECHPPAVVYLAIGCARPHKSSPQQYPPQIAAMEGSKVCILVDPELESPPVAYERMGIPNPETLAAAPCVEYKDATFFPIRRAWSWRGTEEQALMKCLLDLAVYGSTTRLIVQQFTGDNIHRYYPLDRYPVARLTTRVLYDMTGYNGGCFVNFDDVHIYTDIRGNFYQIPYTPLWLLGTVASPAVVAKEAKHRQTTIMNYVHRLWRIQTGREEERYWCTPDTVAGCAVPLFVAYDILSDTDTETLLMLMTTFATDLGLCTGTDVEADELRLLITAPAARGEPFDAYLTALCAKITAPQ